MKLITEDEIKEAAQKSADEKNTSVLIARPFFRDGVSFAEEKMKGLMVEFAEWIDLNATQDGEDSWFASGNRGETITTKQVLEKFMEERK